MKQLRTTCDHCGKEMNSMNDYEDNADIIMVVL